MYGDLLDLDALLWPRLLVYRDLLHIVQHLVSFQNLAKHRVLAIQMRRRSECDKELTAITFRSLIGHADNSPSIVSQSGADLVFEELVGGVVDGRGSLGLGVRGGATSLDHEVRDQPVEGAAIVEARGAESEEVFGRLGNCFAEDFELDVTARGVQLAQWSAGGLKKRGEMC